MPRGLHDLQIWNELVCAGRWGRLAGRFGEWLRVKADMEDWPSFAASFDRFVRLLVDLGSAARPHPPATISVLSGDIHFSYAAEIHVDGAVDEVEGPPARQLADPQLADRPGTDGDASRQVAVRERARPRPATRGRPTPGPVDWSIDRGPVFDNCIGELTFDGARADLSVSRTLPYDADAGPQLTEVIDVDLGAARLPVRHASSDDASARHPAAVRIASWTDAVRGPTRRRRDSLPASTRRSARRAARAQHRIDSLRPGGTT